ncbi:MAG: phosphonoacetaldehyde hydrolase [Candidatus Competibacteraceae bacterium]|jgi:phosphonoacetaldehyde hydrolase|nr:phosphonoacetaldehyde hydrolase [Candidatus Competibacteraceae bacterium]
MTEPLAVKAVIFDWAGTVVDYGSRAPMQAFLEVFKRFNLKITIDEARIPMGLPKWDHIHALCQLPRIAEAWRQLHGREFNNADVDAIYEVFVPMNTQVIGDYAELIPGVVSTVRELRNRGLKIGSTTGYVHDIMDVLMPLAAKQGFTPDCMVCAGDLAAGRPTPLMMYQCFIELNVWPAAACVKVDDTVPGIAEGLAAGTWTVGVAVTGNGFGLSPQETAKLSPEEFAERRAQSVRELETAGAHYVIDGVADLLPVIEQINIRLSRGEHP